MSYNILAVPTQRFAGFSLPGLSIYIYIYIYKSDKKVST